MLMMNIDDCVVKAAFTKKLNLQRLTGSGPYRYLKLDGV
jgi:hypothetical protein